MVRVLTALMLLPVPAIAAPALKRTESDLFFPTTVGARWVYERGGGREEVVEVAEVEKVDGELVVSRKGVDGSVTRYTKMVVTPTGLRQDQFNSGPSTVWVLRTDVGQVGPGTRPRKRTVQGRPVEVPAGKFNALRVEWEQGGTRMVSWYARGREVKRVEKRGCDEVVFRLLNSFKAT